MTRFVALILTLALWGAAVHAQPCAQPPGADALRAQLLAQVNARRAARGLPALRPAPRLQAAARVVACDNARRDRMDHTTADGASLGSRLRRQGYAFAYANENLAYGWNDPAAVVQGWMTSAPHRANILSRRISQFGGAVARSRSGRLYWTMVGARPRRG